MSIFKAYDIRGIVPTQLDEATAEGIGRAFVTFLKCDTVVVGRDVRATSDTLFAALARGINMQGADVIDIGHCDSPMFYFSCKDAPAAMMVTASHNPKEYNGFKLCRENAIPISGDTGIKDIEAIFNAKAFAPATSKGMIITKNTHEEFVKFTRSFIRFDGKGRRLKMVADAANGSGAYTFPWIFRGLQLDFVPLFMEPDGTFPNHEANPLLEENMRDLVCKVREEKADIGIAVDGDADRCMFVDETGALLRADVVGALVAKALLADHAGEAVLYDLRSTSAVAEEISTAGGKPIQCRVGHAFIKKQMREHNAVFAAELSGHFYFREHGFTESSAIAAISVLNLMAATGKKLSELVKPIMRYAHSGEINFEVADKDAVLRKLEAVFSDGKIFHMDGLSVEYADWWFNVRASNTEPLLRLNLEAPTPEEMETKKAKIVEIIKSVK
jgi:phosphomannomutase